LRNLKPNYNAMITVALQIFVTVL